MDAQNPLYMRIRVFQQTRAGLGKSSLIIDAKTGRGRVMFGIDAASPPVCKSDRERSAEPTWHIKRVVDIILLPQPDPHTAWLQTEILSLKGQVWHVCCQKVLIHALGVRMTASKNCHRSSCRAIKNYF